MPRLLTCLRLPLLALCTSFALTSCFDHCKKDDPKPKQCGNSPKPATATSGNS